MIKRVFSYVASMCAGGLIVLNASGCAASPPAPPQPTAAPRVLIADLSRDNLDTIETALEGAWQRIKPSDDVAWSPARTPFFANESPPTPKTLWTSYAFAYGASVSGTLSNSRRVARPWARVIYDTGSHTVSVVMLTNTLINSGQIQGVQPLSAESAALLQRGDAVRDWVLSHDSWPQWNAELRELQQFYVTWSTGISW